MAEIIHLPRNIVSREDRNRLESFGGHTIAHGRATRWHWGRNANGDDVFEIYHGGKDEVLAVRVNRYRKPGVYCARDIFGETIASGVLEHVLAELDVYFARLHGEVPEPSA